MREPKVAVIREEFIALTKDPLVAVVLNQLVYWTQRVKDFDFFLQEEQSVNPSCNVSPRHGWIYKTAEDLVEETMLQVSKSTMLRYLGILIAAGWVDKRHNSSDKWDKTIQYRVNLRKLQEDLLQVGYVLPGTSSFTASRLKAAELPKFQNETSKFQNRTFNTEITTETIAEIIKEAAARDFEFEENEKDCVLSSEQLPAKMLEIWKTQVGQDGLLLTEGRKNQLLAVLKSFFENELASWDQFCRRVKASSFLMGEGARKWRVSLDWVLNEANLRKVLEGNYDNPKESEDCSALKDTSLSLQQKKQIQEILQRIEDPTWRTWCGRLPFNPSFSSYLPLWKLERIVGARFLGIEDKRLAWISCTDTQTSSQIGNLQFQLLSAIQKTYPKVSAVRTCLEGENPLAGNEPSLSSHPTSLGDIPYEN